VKHVFVVYLFFSFNNKKGGGGKKDADIYSCIYLFRYLIPDVSVLGALHILLLYNSKFLFDICKVSLLHLFDR
jgi:hypothetical protein